MDPSRRPARRLLDPTERFAEVLFGVIMVMTFTGTLSVTTAGREDVEEMLLGAIGCNLAWGIVDAVMYVITALADRARGLATVRAVRGAAEPAKARRIIAEVLPEGVESMANEDDLESMRRRLLAQPEPPVRPRLRRGDVFAAIGVFLLVVLSTFPVVIPFLLMTDAKPAMRVSNAVAVTMLFLLGYRLGRATGVRPWRLGVSMAILGSVLAALTIALGG